MPKIALIGDFDPEVTAHAAIPKALEIAAKASGHKVQPVWINTSEITDPVAPLSGFDAVWCVPASPYENMDGALAAIRYAREHDLPFLGTCGGYQHAVLEFARNVLGHTNAENGEVNPDTKMPLVAPLVCTLVEQTDEIAFTAGSRIARIHGTAKVNEKFHCSFGIARRYLGLFEGSAMRFTGFDADGDPRAFEVGAHRFFIGTAYQPERSALVGATHPLVEAFVSASAGEISPAS